MHLLLADDDPGVVEPLSIAFRDDGHEVSVAYDGLRAWELFTSDRPDFAVLDVSMPGLDGLALARRIVTAGEPSVPVILLTGRGQESEKVAGLDLGADDYIVKPVGYRELSSRVRAVQRRSNTASRTVTAHSMTLDRATHKFFIEGRQVDLTSTEFLLLLTLMERAGQVVRYASLMNRVWGSKVSNDLMRVTVYRLRHKIEPDPRHPRYIKTVPGVGFLVGVADPSAEQPLLKRGG